MKTLLFTLFTLFAALVLLGSPAAAFSGITIDTKRVFPEAKSIAEMAKKLSSYYSQA
jgi:hypothetical protein